MEGIINRLCKGPESRIGSSGQQQIAIDNISVAAVLRIRWVDDANIPLALLDLHPIYGSYLVVLIG